MGLLAPGNPPGTGGESHPEFRGWGYHENCKAATRGLDGAKQVGQWKYIEGEESAGLSARTSDRWVCTECCATIFRREYANTKLVEEYFRILWEDAPGQTRILTIAILPAMESGI